MSTLAEIEAAVGKLPPLQQKKLLASLSILVSGEKKPGAKIRRALKAAAYPPMEGLPADLSVDTKERVRALVKNRHAADR